MARVCVLPAWLAQMAPRCAVRAFPRWHPNCPDIGSLLPSRHRGKDAEAENGIWGASSSPRGWRCAGCGSGAWSVRLWTSMDFFGRTCCRGRKTRLQLRSSLATSAKKVFGKQRLTRLVNVSFPAPNFWGKQKAQPGCFPLFVYGGLPRRRVSKAVMHRIANPCRSVRLRHAPPESRSAVRFARMVKLVDTRDLKSLASNGVPVRFRFRAPTNPFCLPSVVIQSGRFKD